MNDYQDTIHHQSPIEDQLAQTAGSYRQAVQPVNAELYQPRHRPTQKLVAAFAVVALLAVAAIGLISQFGSDDLTTDTTTAAATEKSPATDDSTDGPDEPNREVQVTEPSIAPSTAVPRANIEGLPYLVLDDNWEIENQYFDTYESETDDDPPSQSLVARLKGGGLGTPSYSISLFPDSAESDLFSTDDSTVTDLNGGRSMAIHNDSDNYFPVGQHAAVTFDTGEVILAQAYGATNEVFEGIVRTATINAAGQIDVSFPAGYESTDTTEPLTGPRTYRETAYLGPNGESAEVRIWTDNIAGREQSVFGRAVETEVVESMMVDDVEVVFAAEDAQFDRVWIVGGADDFTIEMDLQGFGPDKTAIVDFLSNVHFTDEAGFEASFGDNENLVASEQSPEVIDDILADIPLPDGVEIDLSQVQTTGTRYQIGASITSAATCLWLDRWSAAKASGDTAAQQEAVDAMATSKTWKILLEMEDQGGWSSAIWDYADTIAGDGVATRGKVFPLEDIYADELDCNN